MKWVTRERPKIDRIACPWLITRFIDPMAEFLYVPADRVMAEANASGAVPYDIPGVELSHVGELCSFDAFLDKYRLEDSALAQLAMIVRGADTSRPDLTPQSSGLYSISLGLSRVFADDHEMLAHGMVMYDALTPGVATARANCTTGRRSPGRNAIAGLRKTGDGCHAKTCAEFGNHITALLGTSRPESLLGVFQTEG
jgi:hypothetical protein